MAKVYPTAEGLWVSEKINIKEECLRLSKKVKEFEESFGVYISDSACAEGPQRSVPDNGVVEPDRSDQIVIEEAISGLGLDLAKPEADDRGMLQAELNLIPDDVNLETIRLRRRRSEDGVRKKALKYGGVALQNNPPLKLKLTSDLVPNETVVVVFRTYWPFLPALNQCNQKEPKFNQEIVMLGHHKLDLLRDQIFCSMDVSVPGDLSENPNDVPNNTAKDVYKSGFIFINDTFYNDFRHPDNIDYSEVIRNWALQKKLGPFQTTSMEDTKIEDLTVQLGYPYVFQHQGDCEHLLTVSDVRLLKGTESRLAADYPYVRSMSSRRMKYCVMCAKFPAKWITEGSIRAPFNPCYYCDYCFRSYNYEDGKKIGQFKAYLFKDPMYV